VGVGALAGAGVGVFVVGAVVGSASAVEACGSVGCAAGVDSSCASLELRAAKCLQVDVLRRESRSLLCRCLRCCRRAFLSSRQARRRSRRAARLPQGSAARAQT
jgi:hypothetical protein